VKKIFIAFTGPKIDQQEICRIEDGFECWNLRKFAFDEFAERIKSVIPPVNKNVLRNYRKDRDDDDFFGITESAFKKCSWGLLLTVVLKEDVLRTYGNGYPEILFLLNLYSAKFLYPVFHVTNLGIERSKHGKESSYGRDQAEIFKSIDFVRFFNRLLPQSIYGEFRRDRCERCDEEDWRLFVASLFFSELKKYDNSKDGLTWPREPADMATILESLFTAGDSTSEEIGYRLRKRMAVLIGFKFPSIENDIKELYKMRSNFIHGELFAQLCKGHKKRKNNAFPFSPPDFKLLYRQKEFVRLALLAYLNLAFAIKSGDFGRGVKPIDVLEKAIIDLELRQKVVSLTEEVFSLLPSDQITRAR